MFVHESPQAVTNTLGPSQSPIQAAFPPTFQLTANPIQRNPDPRSLTTSLDITALSDTELRAEIDLLQAWIQSNGSHPDIHDMILKVTEYRDEYSKRTGFVQSPAAFTKRQYNRLHKKHAGKSLGKRKKAIKALKSPTGHQAGEGGWLESNTDNHALFDAYFSGVLPPGVAVDDLKVLSSDFSTHNPGYHELPPPDLWPEMKKSLQLINEICALSGMTYKVASAYRSYRVNALAGGSKGSSHMKFLGLDLNPLGNKTKNEAFLKYFWSKVGRKRKMGLGFYNTGRQHIDAWKYRSWSWTPPKRAALRKTFVKHWGAKKAKEVDAL